MVPSTTYNLDINQAFMHIYVHPYVRAHAFRYKYQNTEFKWITYFKDASMGHKLFAKKLFILRFKIKNSEIPLGRQM